MTPEPEYVSMARQMRAEGLTLAAIAAHMNQAGVLSPKGLKWSTATVQRALSWTPPPDKQTWEAINNPHELLKANPNHSAALMDLEDRRQYFATGKYCHKRIKAVYARYAKG